MVKEKLTGFSTVIDKMTCKFYYFRHILISRIGLKIFCTENQTATRNLRVRNNSNTVLDLFTFHVLV